jgi:predicted DNA binding CopG/RHH family protein
MERPQPIPQFATEAEEAEWWHQQRDRFTASAEAAETHGELKLRRLDSQTFEAAKNITIRVAGQDLRRARELAAKRGLPYQTNLKMLLHEALDNEEKRLAS